MQPAEYLEPVGIRVPQMLWITMLISVVLLLFIGSFLFFQPDLAKIYWSWQLTPFNTRFLGAIYLSALIPLLFCLIHQNSAPLRIVLPIFTFFTTFLLIVSCLYAGNFYLGRKSASVWFFLYGMDSFIGIYYLWHLRKQLWQPRNNLSVKWHQLYRLEAIILGIYGVGLLLITPLFSSLWSWNLDLFHSHLYSGVFLSSALALWLLSYSNSRLEHLMLNLTQTVLGSLIAIGLWIVDAKVHKLNWNSVNPWIWSASFSLFALIGLLLLILILRNQPVRSLP
jgi:hypothetical protein